MAINCMNCGNPTSDPSFDLCKDCHSKGKKSGSSGSNKPKESKLQISLSCGGKKESSGEYRINFVAVVSKEGKNLENKDLEVVYAGTKIIDLGNGMSSLMTDQNGQAGGNFKITAKAGQEVEITINVLGSESGTLVRKINMPPDPPKPSDVDKFEPRLIGRDGVYTLNVQLTFVNGPPREVDVQVTEQMKHGWKTILMSGSSYPDKTKPNGFLSIPLNPKGFKEEQRKIVIEILGTTIDFEVYLDGPKRQWKPKKGVGLFAGLKSIADSIERYSK